MAAFRFSPLAETDLVDIATYTLQTWGEEQTIRYIDDLQACCQTLADNPELGHACDDVGARLRRFETGRHVVFYRKEAEGILVSRILHRRMLPERHSMDEEDEESTSFGPNNQSQWN